MLTVFYDAYASMLQFMDLIMDSLHHIPIITVFFLILWIMPWIAYSIYDS